MEQVPDVAETLPECAVCLDVFKQPQILPACGHSLCGTCVERLDVIFIFNVMGVSCPSCNVVSEISEAGFPVNYALQDALSDLDAQKRNMQNIEKARDALEQENNNLNEQLQDSEAARDRAKKAQKKFQQEVEDITIEVNTLRVSSNHLSKTKLKLDQALAEERAKVQRIAAERDTHAQESRDRETNVLRLTNDLEQLKARLEESERAKRALQLELDESMSSKDDVYKSVHELQNAKHLLEQLLSDKRTQLIELEDAVQLAENARRRLEVNMQAIKAEHERALAGKEQDGEDKRRALVNERRDLEAELENERRAKLSAVAQKKKLETQLAEHLNRHLQETQQLLTEIQQEADNYQCL